MPTYDYKCSKCGATQEAIRKISERNQGPECCGESMKKQISAPMLQPIIGGGSFEGYHCVVSDEWVDSRKKRREIIAKHDLVEKG